MPVTHAPGPEITQIGDNYALFSDGARTSWNTHLICTCVTAKNQPRTMNCCKHVVHIIRNKHDRLVDDKVISVPIVLPDLNVKDADVSWVYVQIADGILWIGFNSGNSHEIFIGPVDMASICRLDARALVIPHILGMVGQVTCIKCNGTPASINALYMDRTNQANQLLAIREVTHWLDDRVNLCLAHDDSDLVPF